MINRPFEGNLHHDLGITEATDETITSFFRRNSYHKETVSLLTALNNSTSKTDSQQGGEQLMDAIAEIKALIEMYIGYVNEFTEQVTSSIKDYPLIPQENAKKIIEAKREELIESLASKICKKFGNISTSPELFSLSKQMLRLASISRVSDVFFYIRESASQINQASKEAFDNASTDEQVYQFVRNISYLAEKLRLQAIEGSHDHPTVEA